jgi:DNA-binding CsgD family transcriptional regulator
MTLVDLTEPPQPSAEVLQKLFGLTAAETELALEIARGLRLREAADALGIEMPMATAQMASIFAKTGTQQQGELVALLSRLTVLS